MIVVSTDRVRVDPPVFRYRIAAPGRYPATTEDPKIAALRLEEMGVPDPEAVLRHARDWGSLEIEHGNIKSAKTLPK
jgi:hypothetical protein